MKYFNKENKQLLPLLLRNRIIHMQIKQQKLLPFITNRQLIVIPQKRSWQFIQF